VWKQIGLRHQGTAHLSISLKEKGSLSSTVGYASGMKEILKV
jgi:hypothetical protein